MSELFEVIFESRIRAPRSMVIEIGTHYLTVITEGLGIGYASPRAAMTKEQWLDWFASFQDELTGREFREARAAVHADFVPPAEWQEFKDRYATTGTVWISEAAK